MNYKIGTRVKVVYSKMYEGCYQYGVISGIKPFLDGFKYYVVDNWYCEFQITLPSNEELGTFY